MRLWRFFTGGDPAFAAAVLAAIVGAGLAQRAGLPAAAVGPVLAGALALVFLAVRPRAR